MRKKTRLVLFDLIPTIIKTCIAKIMIFFGAGKKFIDAWLIAERGNDARDNGYFFMSYLVQQHPEVNAYYIIKQSSEDYYKVAKFNNIRYGSVKHYIALFRAHYLISTHILGYTPNATAFSLLEKYGIVRMPSGKRIFLQHGITSADIDGLKYPFTKVDLFICGAREEYEYVLRNYNYPKGVVKLTGLARYDTLKNISGKKQILIMPTWRKWLNGLSGEEFIKSDYFLAYNDVLSNPEFLNFIKSEDYTVVFYLHYELQKFSNFFKSNDDRIIIAQKAHYDVQMLLRMSDILITDYSSVYFDFAYMRKPIVYYQFDQKHFFADHYQKGYFDEKRFGPVCLTSKDVVRALRLSGEKRSQYAQEERLFFGDIFKTKSCCEEIYKNIISIDNK